jgi:hypothetical protein
MPAYKIVEINFLFLCIFIVISLMIALLKPKHVANIVNKESV